MPNRALLTAIGAVALLGATLSPTASGANSALLEASPTTTPAGTTISVRGSGFPKNTKGVVVLDAASTGASYRATGNGTFSISFRVPAGTPAGTHVLSARGFALSQGAAVSTLSTMASTSIAVVADSPTPSPSATPTPASTPTPTATPTPRPTAIPTPTPIATTTPTPAPTSAPTPTPTVAPPATQPTGYVQAVGAELRLDGLPYTFAGVDLYNANSRDNCWYPLGYSNGALATALSYIPKADAFRAWFYQGQALTNGARDWSAFDHTLSVAAQYGKKVVVQLAGEGGDCGDYPTDQKKTVGWYSNGYKVAPAIAGYTSYRQWALEFAARYANNPTVLMIELVGEAEAPNDQSGSCSEASAASAMRSFVDDIGALVKSVDANHLVTLGVIGTGQCGASGTDYSTIHASQYLDICTTEDYGNATVAIPGDVWNGMQTRINQCAAVNKPLFVQELGIKLDAEAGGSTLTRASLYDAKLTAQFAAGVAGELLWDYVAPHDLAYGGGDPTGFDLGQGDPSLSMLGQH